MRKFKSNSLLKLVNSYLIDSPQPSNISYLWNFGSLLAACLGIQIVTGLFLTMHYNPSVAEAFNSVEHIMRDVEMGWLIRYIHSNTASAFFFFVYLHIGRGMYYGSYRGVRKPVWVLGTIILIMMIGTGFLGYLYSPIWYESFLINIQIFFNNIIINNIINIFIIIFIINLTLFYLNSKLLKQKSFPVKKYTYNSIVKFTGKRYYSINSKNNNKKTILQRIWLGFKHAWKLPSLPAYVENFHNLPITRIFRVIGGISIVLFLSSFDWIEKNSYFWIILILAMLHFIYLLLT